MNPYSTAVADALATNPFEWRRVEAAEVRTVEQIKSDANRADMLARYHARTAKEKAERSYATRFKTPEALEAHRSKARIYDKVQRDKAAMARNAQRVKALTELKGPVHNYGCLSETPQSTAKTARLVGRRNGARSQ